MNAKSLVDIKIVAEALIFANTPRFLYKSLRSADFAYEISQRFSAEQLTKELRALFQQNEDKDLSAATAYGILAALSFFNYRNVATAYLLAKSAGLQWADEFQLFHMQEPLSHFTTLEAPPIAEASVDISTQKQSLNVTPTNRIQMASELGS